MTGRDSENNNCVWELNEEERTSGRGEKEEGDWKGGMFLLHRTAAKTIKECVEVGQGDHKERETNRHPHDSPSLQVHWSDFHLHPSSLRSLSPSCISSLSVVKIYHYCAHSSSSCCSFTQGSRADISVRWLGVLTVTVNWLGRRGKRHYCEGRSYQL